MKKTLLALMLVVAMLSCSGCVSIAASLLNVYGDGVAAITAENAGNPPAETASVDDVATEVVAEDTPEETESAQPEKTTVTISAEEYARYQQFDELLTIMDYAELFFYEEVDTEKMLQGAAAGMMSMMGDVYSFYYTPESYSQMWEDDDGEYAGVGMQITTNYNTGVCTISRVFKNTPAEAAGVRKGDILLRVGDDLEVNSSTINDAVSIMRGTPGTDVDVTFLRDGEELTLTMTRAVVHTNWVDYCMLQDNVGYIILYEFSGDSEKSFAAAVNDLVAQGAQGLIIDLRDNPGGWVESAGEMADLFLDAGVVTYFEYKSGYREYLYSADGKIDIPLVVMINENSASASELMSGCLKERANATLVGTQSFGKGIVQAVLSVGTKGAGMQMTVARYYTPEGNCIHKIGLTPDVIVEQPEDAPTMYELGDLSDVQLAKALEVMLEKMQTPVADTANE